MLPFSLFLALKYLKPKRSVLSVVTVISVLGVLLGVAILVIVLSVMTGFDNMWRDKILSFKPHLTVMSGYGEIQEAEAACKTIDAVPGIVGSSPVVETLVLLQHDGRAAAPFLLGVDADRIGKVSRVPEFMYAGDFSLGDDELVVGYDLARAMGLRVGSQVLVHSPQSVTAADEIYLPRELTVSGIFDMGMRDYDARFVISSLYVARELAGLEQGAQALYVMTDDPFRFVEYTENVRVALGPDYFVRSWEEIDSVMFNALRTEKTMMFILLVFITIVAIFCVTNTLIVITVQKTNEIGLLKALGFSSARIMAAFVWHGWIQCLVGIASGIGAGLLVLHNLQNIVDLLGRINIRVFPKEIYGFSEIPWDTSFGDIFFISFFVMLFCTLSSILPAWRAARLDPVTALRHE